MGEESPERINPSRVSLESLKLEEEKKRTKSLDSRRTQYHPIPRGAERGGKEGLQEEENQLQGLLLHQIHHLQQQPPPKKRSYYPSPSSGRALYQQHRPPPSPSRLPRLMGAAGQIVPVQGGHIVRSTGRKDRHSKVCTAKGLRDRRVRLSAQTAIQFYDVQDRLGYDRPSKAVDWLINNAKAAIDELAELPPWQPTAYTDIQEPSSAAEPVGNSSASFLPPSLDSDAIAESFFPVGSSSSPTISYHNFPPDLLSRSSSEAQDLRLSLQSFQDPVFHHHQQSPNLFSSSATLTIDTTSANYWNVAETTGSGGGEGYVFSVPAPPVQSVLGFGQSQFFTQGGPLQSNNLLSVRAWMDPIAAAAGHEMRQAVFLPSSLSVSDMGFGSGGGGFSGFRIPARIQDGENLNGGISDQPPSGSSASRH